MPAKLFSQAVEAHRAGRFDEAEQSYRKLLAREPGHADALRLLGGLFLQKGQWQAAHDCLEPAARARPDDAETLTNAGLALRGLGRRAEAADLMRRAVGLKPDYAPALGNLAGLCLDAGEYAEAVGLYEACVRLQPGNPGAHYNLANALLSAGRTAAAVQGFERALQLKPDFWQAMVALGLSLARANKAEESRRWMAVACSWFEKALAANPNDVIALNNYANVLRQMGSPADAVLHYRRALAVKPDYVEALTNLATSLRDIGDYDGAIEACLSALRLKPDASDARINLGVFYQDLSRHDEAVAVFEAALAVKPQSLDAKWNRSMSLLALGRYDEGWRAHEVGLGILHMRGDYAAPHKRWDGAPFPGKRLMLWSEQGYGDTLQFVRYAALCKQIGGEVLVLCPKPLRELLRNCPFIDGLPESGDEDKYDCHVPMMSLPYAFGTRLETIPAQIPYLFVSEEKRARWAGAVSGAGLKVGLVWAGKPREEQINASIIDRRRSMTLAALAPLFDVPGVQFVNLQMGAAAVAQIDICGLRDRLIDPMADVHDFEDTAAIVEQLDLVISVDTSVVHLTGGLGKPVWVLSRFDACWRWLQNRADSPWYPTARVYGQKKPGDWETVVARVHEDLGALAKQPR